MEEDFYDDNERCYVDVKQGTNNKSSFKIGQKFQKFIQVDFFFLIFFLFFLNLIGHLVVMPNNPSLHYRKKIFCGQSAKICGLSANI